MPRQFNHLPFTAAALHRAAAKAVDKIAFDLQAVAQAKAPFQTGYLKSSIYTNTWTRSTYGQGVEGEPGALLPDIGKPPNDQTAFVSVGASYGVYLEYGTSRMAARPYMTPAAEEIAPVFEQVMSRLEEKLREEGVGL